MVDLDLSNADRRLAERALANKHIKSAAWQYIHMGSYLLSEEFPDISLACINKILKGGKLTITDAYDRLTDMRAKGTAAKHQGPPRQLKMMDSVKQEGTWLRDATLEIERARGLQAIKGKEAARVAAEIRNVEESIAAHAMIECGCCFGEAPLNRTIQCDSDEHGHYFCYECGSGLVRSELGNGRCRPTCMDTDGCQAEFTIKQLSVCLDQKTLDHLLRLQQQEDIRAAFAGLEGVTDELLDECPRCDYLAVCPPKEVNREFECVNPECMKVTCRLCQRDTHAPKTCEDAVSDAKINARHTVEEAMSEALVRSCNKCKTKFIKESGCNKMTCYKCHNTQCYLCSENVTGYDHFDRGKCAQDDGIVGIDAYHAAQVKKAEELARAKVQNERPDISADDLTIKVSDKVKQAEAAKAAAAAARRQQIPDMLGYVFGDDGEDDEDDGHMNEVDLDGLMHAQVPRGGNFGPVNNFAGAGHRLPGQPAVLPRFYDPVLPVPANPFLPHVAPFGYLRHPALGLAQQPHALERPPGMPAGVVAPPILPAEPLPRLPRTYQAPAVTAARIVRHAGPVQKATFPYYPPVPRPYVEPIPAMQPLRIFMPPPNMEEVQFLGHGPLVNGPNEEAARQRQQVAGADLQQRLPLEDQPLKDQLAAVQQRLQHTVDHQRRREDRRQHRLELERQQQERRRTLREVQLEQAVMEERNRQRDAAVLEPRPEWQRGQGHLYNPIRSLTDPNHITVDLTSTAPGGLQPYGDDYLAYGAQGQAFNTFLELDELDHNAPATAPDPFRAPGIPLHAPPAPPAPSQAYGLDPPDFEGFQRLYSTAFTGSQAQAPPSAAPPAWTEPQAALFAPPAPPAHPAPPTLPAPRPPLAKKRKYDHNIQTRLPVLPVTKVKIESKTKTEEVQMRLLDAGVGGTGKAEERLGMGMGTRDEPIMLDG